MERVFSDPEEELEYLRRVKSELDECKSKEDVVEVWKRHYLKVGHRKLGRLLIGRSPESIVEKRRGE